MSRPDVIDLDDFPRRPTPGGGGGIGIAGWLLLALILVGSARSIARVVVDFAWWGEMQQTETWWQMLLYAWAPSLAAGLIAFPLFYMLSARAARRTPTLVRTVVVFAGSLILGGILIDNWTVVRYYGSLGLPAGAWTDPVFGNSIGFYFFQLPFYEMLLRYALGILIVGFLLYWIANRFEALRDGFARMQTQDGIDLRELGLGDALNGMALRVAAALFFLLLAGRAYLSRFDVLFEDHSFLVGADYVDVNITLPMIWVVVAACVAAAGLVMARQVAFALGLIVISYVASGLVPKAVNALSVRPNEISLQKPYITRHIAATREAFGLAKQLSERDYDAQLVGKFEPAKYQDLLEDVRLWDWKAFHDTITQIQALRPYYVFADTDVDRYRMPDGRMRQVLISPRELDVRQLPDAQSRWINPHFIYTHGYGLVMAEANRITSNGMPELMMRDAPLERRADAPEVKRPEIYYGEAVHEPVFVRSGQPEFSYPSGNENVHSRYEGKGGILIDGWGMRFAAAVAEGDWNIMLTSLLTPESRMMIHRRVAQRVDKLAEFISWDGDPYLVISKEGRLVYMLDGYTTHSMHPYSRSVSTGYGRLNYIRNSVKATVDAYDGTTILYAWDDTDPVLSSYRKIFPKLFVPASEMPADLREHTRYPETIFRIQAEMFRTYHMQNPEAFYNREDPWDLARTADSTDGGMAAVTPTYLMATLPGETKPEFLLLTTFTPRNKQNLIGLMAARCDGDKLGELKVLKLSKQELIYGPMQVAARINQDQSISKDLTLWNQQGSRVIKGQILVLPLGAQFLYVQPIYLQASNAPMPELKKVAVAFGTQIGYGDSYPEALAQLGGGYMEARAAAADARDASQPGVAPAATEAPSRPSDSRIDKVRSRLVRYKQLMGQGKFVEAARELEAIESEIKP